MGLHKNIPYTCNHIAHSLEYANAAARTGASGLTVDDVGRIAMQLDDDSFWILQDHSPVTWCSICSDGTSVESLNEFTGAVTISAGTNVTVNSGSNDIKISASFAESADVDSLNSLQGVLTLDAGPNITISSGGTSIAISGTDPGNHTTVNEFSGSVDLVAGPNISITSGSGQIVISGTVVDTDIKVKVSSDDTTADYLFNKLVAGPDIVITEANPGGDEKVVISSSFVESTDVDSLNSQTGAVNIVAGPNVSVGADNGNVAVSASVTTVNTFSGTVTFTAGDDINIVNNSGDVAISSTFSETADVDSLNEFTGVVTISAGTNVTVNSGSNDIKISASFVESADVDSLNGLQGTLTLDAGPNITINAGGTSIAISGTDPGNHTTVNEFSGSVDLVAGPNISIVSGSGQIVISGTVTDTDVKVKVSSDDTTADFLYNKLVAGPDIVLTEANPGGDEKVVISSSFVESADVDSLNGQTGTVNIVAGPNIDVGADNGNVAVSASVTTVNTFSGTITLTAGDDINIVNNSGDIAISSTFAESADVDSLNGFIGDVDLIAGPNIAISSGSGQIIISGTVVDTDIKVKVSSDDTTADYLYNKLVAGPDIVLTEANPGGNEKVVISGTFVESADVDSINSLQGVVTVTAGPNITVNTAGQDISITGSDVATPENLATVQTVRKTDLTVTNSYADISMDTTAVENNPLIVEHDDTNTERINILETGLYMVSYAATVDVDESGDFRFRVYEDNTIEVSGSCASIDDITQEGDYWHISNTFLAEFTSGSYLTFQVQGPAGVSVSHLENDRINFSVTRMQGSKGVSGSQGPPGEDTDVNGFSGSVSIVAGPNIVIASGSNEIVISGTVTDTDVKVKVSSDDTTADYLYNKLVAGPDIVLTEANPGGDEKVVISSSFVESADVDSLNSFTGVVTVSAGTNTTVNSAGNDIKISASFVESADVDSLNAVQGVVTITAGPNITVNTVGQDISITGSDSGGIVSDKMFQADQLESPNSSDWVVNELAPLEADDNNVGLVVRSFDDGQDEGVGFTIRVPTGATNIILGFLGRARTAPGSSKTVALDLYKRSVPDNGAVSSWSSATSLTNLSIPTNEYFQKDSQTISLATLGLTVGVTYQFELCRDFSADTLSGDWLLHSLTVGWS